ncbi:small subunit processome component 20-like protein [Striga asiatica]|uniref:Small subunit processome component 20-like protein n=1 Tax=Striga asiatica TaxID=4170 RepID=A0A5A7QTY7_STRAF|nr:small subunit processome component 20-like protein [Striga asiatica]
MATLSDARAVKSLNNSAGRRRFVFKTIAQRIEEIDINVYRRLDPLIAEPSEGSSFFRDTLVQYRELNTAEDFIAVYEELLPLVQTLPQIILQKDFILSSLLSRMTMEARLSQEPILRLIAALSRDLLEDFIPFLQRIADSFGTLLESGADRDPEIIEQIFTSWSYIMMYLQKYLMKDVGYVLRVTANLRYYPKDYVREFMAESVSFVLRKTPVQQLRKDIMILMAEVEEEPSEMKKSGVAALLSHVMRITSSRLHSKAEALLPLLVDDSSFQVCDLSVEGSRAFLEVLTLAFERLYEDLDGLQLAVIWKCLCEKIADSVGSGNFVHLSRLLTLLISILQNDNRGKISDYGAMVELVGLLVRTYFASHCTMKVVDTEDTHNEVIDKVLDLMLCIIGGLATNNMAALRLVSSQWVSVFDIRNRSLLTFIENLLMKDRSIFHVFRTHIIRAFSNLIEISQEEVLYLMVKLCEKFANGSSSVMDGESIEELSVICNYFQETLHCWIRKINEVVKGNLFAVPFQQNELAVLWGVIRCYSHFADAEANPSLLMDLINVIDKLLMVGSITSDNMLHRIEYILLEMLLAENLSVHCSEDFLFFYSDISAILLICCFGPYMLSRYFCVDLSGFQESTWYSLIAAALRAYHKLVFSRKNAHDESAIIKFLDLVKRYKLSPKILSAVAESVHSLFEFPISQDRKWQLYFPEYIAGKTLDALDIFAENLCHANREIRLSTICILCHYEPLHRQQSKEKLPVEDSTPIDVSEASHVDDFNNVLNLLRSIEETELSIATSREVTLRISKIQMSLSSQRLADQYIPVVLSGIIGIFHNRFSYLWTPALECLAVLVGQYSRLVWSRYIEYLDHCQSVFLASNHQHGDHHSDKVTGLVGCFTADIFTVFDSTPSTTVLSLLIQTLQRVPSVVESHSRQIVPLFLKFLGYSVGEITRLLNQNDADIQMLVLDCLLNWKDDFLLPYAENLKNLINAKTLREELTRWNLSRTSMESIDIRHRAHIVPIVIRTLMPKVKNKNASGHHRRAVLGFLTQLDVDELPLFFWLLIKPLLSIPQSDCGDTKSFWSSPQIHKAETDESEILKYFTMDTIMALSWKKIYGFLHVVEDIFTVFDEPHVNPFLNLLMHFVVRILASCTSSFGDESSSVDNYSSLNSEASDHNDVGDKNTERKAVKKDLRSLCLKIIFGVLCKYEDHDFGGAFWDTFFVSIGPLIANFRQEGASSKKPSSLFYCFLAMSKNYKLVPLLVREKSLVPDIISMLTVPSASESILSCVLKFIKNLLKLDSELGSEDTSVKRVLLPHLELLISSLHSVFTSGNGTKRLLAKSPGKRDFTIFSLLSKYIQETSAAETFIDMLFPLLTKTSQNFDTCIDILQMIRQLVTVMGSGSSKKVLISITPLLISAGLVVRNSICDVLDSVAANDSSVLILAQILRELNATSEVEMGALDYDKVLCAYDKINVRFFCTISEEHALPILAHAVHDMSSEELILRQSAFRLLLSFIEFSGEILSGSLKPDQIWSETSIQRLVNNFFLKHMRNAMIKESAVKKVWIDLLREMILKIPKVANLESYRALCCDDAEQDFFRNIVHLQKHRRAKAVSLFGNIVSSGNLSEVITNKVFVPLLLNMLFDAENGKDEHIKSACVDALASISGRMKWDRYYGLLLSCFNDLKLKPDKQKILLRLICSILDHFHFSESSLDYKAKNSASDTPDPYTINMRSLLELRKSTNSVELPEVQMCLHKKLFPMIQKLLASNSDNINVNMSLVALKILKLLPGEIMDSQLPTIIHRISNFLKNRLESVRDEARSALAACLKELGLEYLQFIVKVLKSTLKRGYELHVLGYTLNFLLSKFIKNPISGRLDYCLEDLLSVVENDILGDVSEEKEVDKIASKMKETRKQKSYETLKLIAQSITFKTCALKLLSPVTAQLHKQLTQKVKVKLENMLNHIASGIECNPSVNQTELFIFVNCLIKDGIDDEGNGHGNSYISSSKTNKNDESVRAIHSNKLVNVDRQFSHLITAFSLGVLQNYMKTLKLNKEDELLLSLLDPFVSLLGQCLSSKHENIIISALRCLSVLVRLPLPSFQSEAEKIKTSLLVIAQGSVTATSLLTESCLKLLTMLLRSTRVTLSADQLHMLIQFPLFVDLAKNPTFVALSLLKAIVNRKLVVPEIYDVVQIVAELMIQSQHEPIRKKCSQILLQFLLGYHLSEKRLQQHLDFLLANLRYEHSTGREAVLEMLHAIIIKFPKNVVDTQSQTLFLHLVVSLTNDEDSKVRSMAAAAMKCLIGHVSLHSLQSILEYSLSWYLGDKQNLWAAAAQVLGLLLEVMGKSFEKHLNKVFPVMRSIFQSAVSSLTSSEQNLSDEAVVPFWKEAYYSLVLLEKILKQFHDMFFDKDLEDIWESLCSSYLLHPHMWLRTISNRILSHYFAAVTDACKDKLLMEKFVLMKPSILFHTAVCLCCQLKVPMIEDGAGTVILQNLVFAVCGLHAIFENDKCMDVSTFWSSLDRVEQDRFLKAFGLLDPRKGRRTLTSLTCDASGQQNKHHHPFISLLLQRMGKIAFQMEASQIKIVFNCFKLISPKLLGGYGELSAIGSDDLHSYAYHILLPLYRVSEGYTGMVVTDDLKQIAEEAIESIKGMIGVQNFIGVYSQIRKNLKAKRDKRKREEKVMAVVNPIRNAKRKLRMAAKHQAHKKRKIMTMKMGRWMR